MTSRSRQAAYSVRLVYITFLSIYTNVNSGYFEKYREPARQFWRDAYK